jgi:hypothetical protein
LKELKNNEKQILINLKKEFIEELDMKDNTIVYLNDEIKKITLMKDSQCNVELSSMQVKYCNTIDNLNLEIQNLKEDEITKLNNKIYEYESEIIKLNDKFNEFYNLKMSEYNSILDNNNNIVKENKELKRVIDIIEIINGKNFMMAKENMKLKKLQRRKILKMKY